MLPSSSSARAWHYRHSFAETGSFEGWLLRICRNCLIDLAARRFREVPVAELPDTAVDPDESHDLHDALAHLPIAQREVVVICGLLGYDYESASAILDVPVGTVRSRLHRARAALTEALDAGKGSAAG